jgi:hypothetical protein
VRQTDADIARVRVVGLPRVYPMARYSSLLWTPPVLPGLLLEPPTAGETTGSATLAPQDCAEDILVVKSMRLIFLLIPRRLPNRQSV